MLVVKNLAYSTLASDITDVATSLTVAAGDGAKFPSTFPFHLSLDVEASREIVKCTARTTDTMTVVRAQEGTTGAAHSAGATVALNITAGVIQENCPVIVRKTADETVNNSATLQNDDHLFLAIGANEIWLVELFLLHTTITAGYLIKFGWAYPTSCLINWGCEATGSASAINYWSSGSQAYKLAALIQTSTLSDGIQTNGSTSGFHIIALVINGANAGTLNLQWAQDSAYAQNTKVLTNSYLIAHKLA